MSFHFYISIFTGTSAANRLEQLVLIMKKKLNEKSDPEESILLFRTVIEEMTVFERGRERDRERERRRERECVLACA